MKKLLHPKAAKSSRASNTPLLLIALPGIIYLLINNYAPMLGIFLAFKDYSLIKGPFGSDWCGFQNFEFLFKTKDTIGEKQQCLLVYLYCSKIFGFNFHSSLLS